MPGPTDGSVASSSRPSSCADGSSASRVEAITDGMPAWEVKDDLTRLATRRGELEALIEGREEQPVLLHPNMAEHYRAQVADLAAALNEEEYRAEAAGVLRSLIEWIEELTGAGAAAGGDLDWRALEHSRVCVVANDDRRLRERRRWGFSGCGGRIWPSPNCRSFIWAASLPAFVGEVSLTSAELCAHANVRRTISRKIASEVVHSWGRLGISYCHRTEVDDPLPAALKSDREAGKSVLCGVEMERRRQQQRGRCGRR